MGSLTSTRARELLDYNPETGSMTWRPRCVSEFYDEAHGRMWNAKHAGTAAGGLNIEGYLVLSIAGSQYKAHRIAWLHFTGQWPTNCIRHRNGLRHDNRFSNLREATIQVNAQNLRGARRNNKASGLLGVVFDKSRGKFMARITTGGKQKNLGRFNTAAEAHAAYVVAKRQVHEGCTL